MTTATIVLPSLSAIADAERDSEMKIVSVRAGTTVAVAGIALLTTACSARPATPGVATLTAAASTSASSRARGRRSHARCDEVCAVHASARRAGFP